jgi:hypothetical protein
MSLNMPTKALYECVGIPQHLPLDFAATFENVQWTFPYRHWAWPDTYAGCFTVCVKPSATLAGKRMAHRVFVVCPTCGREIPAGRWFQHLKNHRCTAIASI